MGTWWVAGVLVLLGCGGGSRTGTGIEEPEDFSVRVSLTNVGDGAGAVDVVFSAGSVDNPCPDLLGPDQSCTVEAEHTRAISSVSLDVEPDAFSEFKGYGGACSGMEECEIQLGMETTQSLDVQVTFDLVVVRMDFDPDPVTVAPGADVSLSVSAYADGQGTVAVEGAEFGWESTQPSVAAVSGEGASVTVSGVQAGETWIRSTARGLTDSVRVVVGG